VGERWSCLVLAVCGRWSGSLGGGGLGGSCVGFSQGLLEAGRDGYGMCRGWIHLLKFLHQVCWWLALLGILTLVLFATFVHSFLCFGSLASLLTGLSVCWYFAIKKYELEMIILTSTTSCLWATALKRETGGRYLANMQGT
jgi:hypothetical protein